MRTPRKWDNGEKQKWDGDSEGSNLEDIIESLPDGNGKYAWSSSP